ncbi:MAG: hypothetical protein HC783_18595 [Rhodobacteraceae bacterium]|nr:hypothetical protein [Paracoccaceae bacterium]
MARHITGPVLDAVDELVEVGLERRLLARDVVPFVAVHECEAGRPATGRGWIGITPREAYLTADINVAPLLPAWAWLILAAGLAVAAWLIEGRKGARAV